MSESGCNCGCGGSGTKDKGLPAGKDDLGLKAAKPVAQTAVATEERTGGCGCGGHGHGHGHGHGGGGCGCGGH